MGLPDPMLGLGDPFFFPPGGGSPPPGMGLFTGTDLTPQGDKSLGVLKGWSSLAGTPVTPGALPPDKTRAAASDTFAAFQKAAKEKADRERSERKSQRMEAERRKEQEEDLPWNVRDGV